MEGYRTVYKGHFVGAFASNIDIPSSIATEIDHDGYNGVRDWKYINMYHIYIYICFIQVNMHYSLVHTSYLSKRLDRVIEELMPQLGGSMGSIQVQGTSPIKFSAGMHVILDEVLYNIFNI